MRRWRVAVAEITHALQVFVTDKVSHTAEEAEQHSRYEQSVGRCSVEEVTVHPLVRRLACARMNTQKSDVRMREVC